MVFVVRSVRQQHPESGTQREEHLSGRVHPDLSLVDGIEVRTQIVFDTFPGTRQSDASDQQNTEHGVREEGSKPNHLSIGNIFVFIVIQRDSSGIYLARCADSLPQRKIANQINGQQAQREIPFDGAQIVNALALV